MNFKLNKFALVTSLIIGFSAKAIPTPEAVEPAFDEEDNPTYVIKYGKGDRLKEDGTPLNLIQIKCKDKAVDMVSEEDLEECRADDSLVEMQYGWMDFATLLFSS